MTFAEKIIGKFDRKIARYAPINSRVLTFEKPVVSFTFDDCPRSAITVGGKMLRDRGLSGTFYLCGGLTNGFENELPCQTEDDLEYLKESNHELASHLYNHKRCETLSKHDLTLEIEQSIDYLNSITGNRKPLSFSYPFGSINLRAKKMISDQFLSGRGISPGLNLGKVDLSCLKANALYEEEITEKSIADLIDAALQRKGWLIFYTHDVQNSPTAYGVKPKTLEFAMDYALRRNCQISSVSEVMSSVR
ncbi:polysaccharide deacetylase family protein [Sneathiella marina]|uniref:Chitooligosaccharide deacetylase n=1 Tax=Sneathiella marina TaxID=2950108 RepID=A0ABY4W5D1_9PROT|nr:polysaccharide deacetylase family protein [Sneathiella marina]USG61313.1 polysaccharide deacetylase family protein [Sneathiella marina]